MHTRTAILSIFLLIVCILCAHPLSLSLYTNIFVSCLIVQFASIDTCAVSMFLVLSSPDLTFTIPSLTYKYTDLSSLSEKFPPENNSRTKSNYCSFTRKPLSGAAENSKQQSQSSSHKGEVWCVNNTTFVPGGQTGKWRQQQSNTCDLTLSVSFAARE